MLGWIAGETKKVTPSIIKGQIDGKHYDSHLCSDL